MDGRVVCVHDPFSGRRYEQFKTAAEYHEFFAVCKTAVHRVEKILRKYLVMSDLGNRLNLQVDYQNL